MTRGSCTWAACPLIERARLLLDVEAARVRLEEPLFLVVDNLEFQFDGVELDTGCGVDVIVPLDRAPANLVAASSPTDPLQTLGGPVRTWCVDGILRSGCGQFAHKVTVHIADVRGGKTLLGLPLLQRCDILLLPTGGEDTRRPALEFERFAADTRRYR